MGWGSSTRRGGGRKLRARPRNFVFLGFRVFRREESGMSREFCRDVPDPWRCSKSLCKKTSCAFFVPYWREKANPWTRVVSQKAKRRGLDSKMLLPNYMMAKSSKSSHWAFGPVYLAIKIIVRCRSNRFCQYRSSKWHYRQRKIIFELIMHFIADTDADKNYFGMNVS